MRFLLFFFWTIFSFLNAQNVQNVIILQTTDVHGHIYPYDYFRDQPDETGLAKAYLKIKEFRENNNTVFLVDCGDLIQGTPLTYYFNHVEQNMPNPMIFTMNYMRYDAFAVGNHDIEQGYFVYYKAERESDFPWLSANGLLHDGSTFFKPYSIIERDGIKVGFLGLTTPAIPMWLDKSMYPGIEWQDMIIAAKKYVKILRPQVDILVGLFHAGMNEDYSKDYTEAMGIPNENASTLVAREVPGFDVIFSGHAHGIFPKENESAVVGNTVMVMAGSRAGYLGVAELGLQKQKITNKKGYVLSVKNAEPAPEILTIAQPYHEKTLHYIRTEIGVVDDTISAAKSRFQDTPLVELINKAQMAATDADISFAACFDDRFVLNPGKVAVKNIYGMYKYENFLYLIEMTGQQIKDYLEFCAQYYEYENGNLTVNRDMAGYNYDMAEGVSYKIDVRENYGERIKDLVFLESNQELDPEKRYKVAMNSYRASGGGGHLSAAGILTPKILWKSSFEMRTILSDYIREKGGIETEVDNNWKVVF